MLHEFLPWLSSLCVTDYKSTSIDNPPFSRKYSVLL